ncbi:MAG: RNA methyltransferase [Lachnospiraceae bacterium]|nr:RNA methyltransferase [Lachnospiraceae bacterium]
MITSENNAQLKNISALLKRSKERQQQGLYVVEGRKMFWEACGLNLVEKAYLAESYAAECREVPCDHEIVSDDVFNKIAETVTPQGVLALVRLPKEDLKEKMQNAESLVLLENLQDPGNLGTIVRTAEAAGIDAVILSKTSVDLYNPKVVRSTMGAVFRMPVFYTDDLIELIRELNNNGFNTIATHLSAEKNYYEADYSGKTAILIGNEGNGLSDEATELAKEKVIIPMEGKVESLNASVAAALMMYEIKRNN